MKENFIIYFRKFKNYLLSHESKFLYINFIKWKLIDLYRFKRNHQKKHLYGVRCFTGMYGQGKTMAMTYYAKKLRDKYGDSIYITSNYGLSFQDFPFNDIKLLTRQFDKPIVYFWDEVQNDFPSTEKNFPRDVRQALTLNRKGHGKMIYWASQDHELVHKTIRRLTIEYCWVKTLSGRLTRCKWFYKDDYQLLFDENDVDKKMKIHPFKKESFVQTDYIRNCYNSFGWDNGEELIKS